MNEEGDVFEKRHTRDSFYKYSSIAIAKLIFGNRNLRWSNPKRFNDPFDSQSHFHTEVTAENFPTLMMDRVEELAKSPEEPVFFRETDMATFIRMMRQAQQTQQFDRVKFQEVFSGAFAKLWEQLEAQRQSYIPFYESYYRKCRVLCLACEPDNILMWSHYAADHHGIAFKLKVAETAAEDDPLWLARPVNYKKDATLFADASVVDQVLGLKPLTLFNPGDLWKSAYEKYEGWKYENEWRVVDPGQEELPAGYRDHTFNLKKIEAVYFGIRCTAEDQKDIIDLLKPKAPHIKYFKARQHPHNYKIEFDPIVV